MLGIKRLERLQAHRRGVRTEEAPPRGKTEHTRGPLVLFPAGVLPSAFTIMPHRVTVEERRRSSFWNPTAHYKRLEFLVEPPMLPGTAIPWTLFHPTYIPGLQGFKDYLPWNFGWAWGRNNFELFGSLVYRLTHPASSTQSTETRQANWKPQMRPQIFGNARVYYQPRPDYTPVIVNPPNRGGRGDSKSSIVRDRRG